MNSDPLSLLTNLTLTGIFWITSQYDNAIAKAKEILSIDSNNTFAYWSLGNIYSSKGNFEEGIAQYQRAIALGDYSAYANMAYAYARLGNTIKAREILADLKTKNIQPGYIANIYIYLGEWDHAFEWLEKAYEEHDLFLLIIRALPSKIDPKLDSIRTDPRFHALVKKMGLEE